jgi:hypothetical protein
MVESDQTLAGASYQNDLRVRSRRRKPSGGVTALFSLGTMNRGVSRPWLRLSTLGDFVFMLESDWDPSNSLVIDSVHPIE